MYDILFVEDDSAIVFILRKYKVWKRLAFTVAEVAENGVEALEKLAQRRFDLIVTDIRMPLMDGLALIRALRERGDETPIIVASTYREFKYAKEALRLGALDFIEKPFTEEKLTETLTIAMRHLEAPAGPGTGTPLPPASRREELLELVLSGGDGLPAAFAEMASGAPEGAMDALLSALWDDLEARFPWLHLVEAGPASGPWREALAALADICQTYALARLDPLCRQICTVVAENLMAPQLIDLAATAVELSRDYMSKQFHRATGHLLSDYITLLRMERAKLLLRRSNLKIYEISEQVGYSTTDYFTRRFKAHTGQTPVGYRRGKSPES